MDNADNGSGGPKSGAGGDCRSVRLASWSVSVAPYHFSPMLMLPFDSATTLLPKARYRTYPILDLFNFSSDSTGNDAQSATGPSPPKLVIRLKYS